MNAPDFDRVQMDWDERQRELRDPLGPARGIMHVALLGLCFWGVVFAVAYWRGWL